MVFGLYRKVVGLAGLAVMGSVMLLIRYVSFGRAINFNRMCVAPFTSRITLWLLGVRVKNHIEQSDEQFVYMFNHNSYLDLFLIPMAGLQNTRFIISEDVQRVVALHLCNLGIDVLYIPTKGDPIRRAQFFERVTDDLSKRKYSVICSPEGQHTFTHGIAPFNDGVFKMATESRTPIRCLFLDIPPEANPLESFEMKPCHVDLYSKDRFETETWRVEDVSRNKAEVRARFLEYYRGFYGDFGDAAEQN